LSRWRTDSRCGIVSHFRRGGAKQIVDPIQFPVDFRRELVGGRARRTFGPCAPKDIRRADLMRDVPSESGRFLQDPLKLLLCSGDVLNARQRIGAMRIGAASIGHFASFQGVRPASAAHLRDHSFEILSIYRPEPRET
jgi:hypothetical protein